MPISFGCDVCGRRLKALDEHAGRRTRCPGCGTILNVPTPPPVEDDDAPYALAAPPARSDPDEAFMLWTKPTAAVRGATAPEPVRTRVGEELIPLESASAFSGVREYLYCVLAVALVPLLVSLMDKEESDVDARVQRTIAAATPEQRDKILPLLTEKGVEKNTLLAAMPEGRLIGAHLSYDSRTHWLYGLISAAAFLGLLAAMFERDRPEPLKLLGAGLFTGTVGILMLLAFQWCASIHFDRLPRGGIGLLFLVLRFVGWSYECAEDPSSSFWLSASGFTFGVGLCEEICKAIPIVAVFHGRARMGWRGACLLGLASGVGFGVSEGIMYSKDMYNGIVGVDVYFLRFASCVALHAMWAGSVGMTVYARREEVEAAEGMAGFAWVGLKVVLVPMILHGFYDTLLKKDMNVAALVVALASFAWFAYLVETCRRCVDDKRARSSRTAHH